jgi:O-antigen/teichoic acid export membrane protein
MNVFAEAGGMLIVRAFTVGSGVLLVTLLARLLGPEAYGIYALSISIVMVLNFFMHLGLPNLITKTIAESIARDNPIVAQEMERFSLRLILIMIVLVSFIVIVLAKYSVNGTSLALSAPFAWIILASAGAYALQQRSMAILNGRRKQLLSQLPDGLVRPLVMLTMIPLILTIFANNIFYALLTYLLANIIALLVGTILVYRNGDPGIDRSFWSQYSNKWVKNLPPFTVIGLVGIIQANADIIVLSSFLSVKDLSIFKVAAFIGAMPSNIHAVVINLLSPRAVSAWAVGDRNHLEQLAINASRSAFAFAMIYALAIWLFGKPLIVLAFGSEYTNVYPIAALLVVGPLFTTAVGSSFTLLNMCDQASLSSRFSAVAVLLTIGGLAIGGSVFGMTGGAIVIISVTAFLSICSWIAVKRRIGVRCDIFANSRGLYMPH